MGPNTFQKEAQGLGIELAGRGAAGGRLEFPQRRPRPRAHDAIRRSRGIS
jgi:hypothetical protein